MTMKHFYIMHLHTLEPTHCEDVYLPKKVCLVAFLVHNAHRASEKIQYAALNIGLVTWVMIL